MVFRDVDANAIVGHPSLVLSQRFHIRRFGEKATRQAFSLFAEPLYLLVTAQVPAQNRFATLLEMCRPEFVPVKFFIPKQSALTTRSASEASVK